MPPNQHWHCSLVITIVLMAIMCSTLFILSMTFERFFSIIRPHKAASFNTVKRAKITIVCIFIFSVSYNLPHLFISANNGRTCISYAIVSEVFVGQIYYWSSLTISFVLPFVTLLTMNSVIIHTLRQRSKLNLSRLEEQGQSSKAKNSDRQIFIMLLLVTFGFLIFTTPVYVMTFYINFYTGTTPSFYAGFHLFYHVGEKTLYTNHGINFFLYVTSGQKFRTDLKKLFCKKHKNDKSIIDQPDNTTSSTQMFTIDTK